MGERRIEVGPPISVAVIEGDRPFIRPASLSANRDADADLPKVMYSAHQPVMAGADWIIKGNGVG
jgi:hypothetical protein